MTAVAGAALMGPRRSLAQARAIHRVGLLFTAPDVYKEMAADGPPGIVEALAALGYVEGRNLRIELRTTAGDLNRVAPHAAELVRLGMDVLVTIGTPQTRGLKSATPTIPIVAVVFDPVASGFANPQGRPSANVTGLAMVRPDTPDKQVELLHTLLPGLQRLAIIGHSDYPAAEEVARPLARAARERGLVAEVHLVKDTTVNNVLVSMRGPGRAAFVYTTQWPTSTLNIIRFTLENKVALMTRSPSDVAKGGLMSYGVSHQRFFAQLAAIIDKILRGSKVQEIPWALPDRSHLALNLSTAKRLGIEVPAALRLRADQVIE